MIGRSPRAGWRSERAQATAEFVLVLPVVIVVLMGLVQTAVLARDQVLVWNALREAGRAAAVGEDSAAVRQAALGAAPGLTPNRLVVETSGGESTGDRVTVEITYRSARIIPFLPIDGPLTHHGRATFRHE